MLTWGFLRLENLQSASGQRENLLSSLSRDTYRAYTWIKENVDRFEKPVFGPPLIECRIKDQRYVEVIEGIVRSNALVRFLSPISAFMALTK